MTNEWGIPDWRDPKAYGDTRSWSLFRWRWEFYRRRDDLREAFDTYAEPTYKANCEKHPGRRALRPDEPGFVAVCDKAIAKKLGYPSLPNPRISNQPEWAIEPLLDAYPAPRTYAGVEKSSKLKKAGSTLPVSFPPPLLTKLHLFEGEVAVMFCLALPIAPQIEAAKEALVRLGAKNQPLRRRQPKKWLGYLRALDARAAGASWAEIAAMFPNLRNKPQAGRDVWRQADALRNNFGPLFAIVEQDMK